MKYNNRRYWLLYPAARYPNVKHSQLGNNQADSPQLILIVTHGFFEPLTMPEVGLLAVGAAGLTCTLIQLGQLPKQFIWSDIRLWAPLIYHSIFQCGKVLAWRHGYRPLGWRRRVYSVVCPQGFLAVLLAHALPFKDTCNHVTDALLGRSALLPLRALARVWANRLRVCLRSARSLEVAWKVACTSGVSTSILLVSAALE